MSNKLPEELRDTVETFLNDVVSQQLSCNGCNDWDFTKKENIAGREFLGLKKRNLNSDFDVLEIIRKALGFDVTPDDYEE